MIFSELYSVYYNTVAKIIEAAFTPGISERELQQKVVEHAFAESVLKIMPALKTGKWPLLRENLTPVVHNVPTMPLTKLEKRWLRSILDDPRLRLFEVKMPELDEVQPLFSREDYKIYDQYNDGDPFEDEKYIRHFRLILKAIKNNCPVKIKMLNKYGKEAWVRFYPTGFEYSLKDDKIRILASGCKFSYFNLGRVLQSEYYDGAGPWKEEEQKEKKKELTLLITDERNALERVMLHFAHLEKQAERIDREKYILRLQYYEYDETEIVIRVLSFGPCVQVLGPEDFVALLKERLRAQKSCGLW